MPTNLLVPLYIIHEGGYVYIYIYMYVCARVHTLHVYQLFKCRVVASNNANTYFFY